VAGVVFRGHQKGGPRGEGAGSGGGVWSTPRLLESDRGGADGKKGKYEKKESKFSKRLKKVAREGLLGLEEN